MEYYVTIVFDEQLTAGKSNSALYLNERKVQFDDIEHSLYYGDIVYHGGDTYYINEKTITRDEHEYTVESVWDMSDGEVPDDGNRYFLTLEEGTYYEYSLKNYLQYNHKIISRVGRNLTIHETWTAFFNRSENTPFWHGVNENFERGIWVINTYEKFLDTIQEHKEKQLKELSEVLGEDKELLDTIIEKVGIKDGEDGKHGEDGATGRIGITGADGKRGETGQQGIHGKIGEEGREGKSGRDGKSGIVGKTGPIGVPGIEGKIGNDGKSGERGKDGKDGTDGRDGKEGPRGKTLVEEVEDPKTAKSFEEFKKEFAHFKMVDGIYKTRLNTQLGTLGGGGSAKILDNDDVLFNYASELSNNDFLVFDKSINKFVANNLVTIINIIKAELEVQYDKLVDEQPSGANTFTFIGEAAPGSNTSVSVWRIKRIAEYANGYLEIIWANDTELFDKDWTIRGTYTYTV